MTHPPRNIILVAGPSASGKTFALNILRHQVKDVYGLPHWSIPISDALTILDRIREDDKNGGVNHYHPWNRGELGHSHSTHLDITPFTLAGYDIGIAFMKDFFSELPRVPQDHCIYYAEWSGGRNINSPDDAASRTDVSFQTISTLLRDGTIPTDGLKRILAVLHMETSREHRRHLNSSRGIPSDTMIRLGMASWQLDETAMKIFGEDDFEKAIPVLRSHRIPIIRTIRNDGRDEVKAELYRVLPEILSLWQGKEGTKRKKESL